jgi:maltose O-acetyltransferase
MKNRIKKVLINSLASSYIIPGKLRIRIYKLCGLKILNQSFLPACYISGVNLEVGEGSWINTGVHFDNEEALIKIGKDCGVGMEVLFCTTSHEVGNKERRGGKPIRLPIVVEDGCWIGARTTILPGINIGKGCIIASNAVVTNNCEPNGLYAGIPAKRIKDLPVS